MNLLSLARRLAVLAAALGTSGAAVAADVTPPPAPVAAMPVTVMPGPSCPTCNGGAPAAHGHGHGCGRLGCGVSLFHKNKAPYVVNLCPGACFGYFQTQWHRWEDVCPLPYQGVGQSDAPPPAPGYVAPVPQPRQLPEVKPEATPGEKKNGKGTEVPEPRPVKPTGPGGLPSIPNVPMPTTNLGR